jgi:hypothetical protein
MKPTHCSLTVKVTTRARLHQAKREMAFDLDKPVSVDDVIMAGLELLEKAGRVMPAEPTVTT